MASVPAAPLMNALVGRSAVNLRRIPVALVPLVVMPIFFAVRMIRRAISPRLAISILFIFILEI